MRGQPLGSGIQYVVSTVVCEPKKGTFAEVVPDERAFPESIVFASVTELKDGAPHRGAAR